MYNKFDKLMIKGSIMHTLKNVAPVIWIIIAVLVLCAGLILIFNTTLAWSIIEWSVAALILAVGLIYLFSVFIKTTEQKLKALGIGALCVLGSAALFAMPRLIGGTFGLVSAVLAIIIGLLVLLNAFKLRRDGAGWTGTLITAAAYLAIGFAMFFAESGGRLFSVLLGLYFVVFSFNIFGDALVSLMGNNTAAQKYKRKVRVPLPTFIAAFLPMKMLRTVNHLVEEDPDELLLVERPEQRHEPDMEIYIHTREGFIPGMGHVDIAVGDQVYTYGNYDDATWKLGGFFADGVMVEMDRETHIRMSLEVEKKVLMVYGLALKPEQKKAILERIAALKADMIPWEPLAQQAEKGEIEGNPEDYQDVASQTYRNSRGRFYKFKKGNPFKTYYAVGTNCVKLADSIVGQSGIDLLRVNGIITPGTYLDYLDSLYERGDSIVVARKIYYTENSDAGRE